MNLSFRKIASIAGVAVALSACSKEPKVTEDVLAQDSTLARQVMTANRDSLTPGGDDSLATAIKSGVISGPKAAGAQTPSNSVAAKPAMRVTSVASTSEQAPAPKRTVAMRTERSHHARVTSRRQRVYASNATGSTTRSTKVRQAARATAPRTADAETTRATTAASAPVATTPPVAEATHSQTTYRASAMIPAGSDIAFTSDSRVCSSTANVGDSFTTHVAEDVVGPLGVVIPKGATATAQVFTKNNESHTNSNSDVGVRIESVTIGGRSYPLRSLVTSSDITRVKRSGGNSAKVLAGAGIGAVLGRMIGHDAKGTIIGAVGGAAAGGVLASQTGKVDHCIPDGGRITARLTEPLKVALTE